VEEATRATQLVAFGCRKGRSLVEVGVVKQIHTARKIDVARPGTDGSFTHGLSSLSE
jgi:hypothetical protein